jgi:hypothetical protein
MFKKILEKNEGEIKDGYSRDTGNIVQKLRTKTNKTKKTTKTQQRSDEQHRHHQNN